MTNIWLTRLYMILLIMIAMILESFELVWGNYAWLSPAWVFILVIFWTVYYPHIFNVGSAWLTGLFMDVWTAELLGKHALLFLITSFLISFSYNNLTKYSATDRLWIIAIIILLYQLVISLIGWNMKLLLSIETTKIFGTIISSILLWCCLSWLADRRTRPNQL